MKKIIGFSLSIAVGVLSLASVFVVAPAANAQTDLTCPAGYVCTPIPTQPTGCPTSYICTPTNGPTSTPSIQVISPNGGEVYSSSGGIPFSGTINYPPKQLVVYLYSPVNGDVATLNPSVDTNGNFSGVVYGDPGIGIGQYKINACDLLTDNPAIPGKPLCDSSDDYFTVSTSTNVGGGGGSSCYTWSTYLGIGSRSPDVVALQTVLIADGFDISAISQGHATKGYFGPSTAAALKLYQQSVGLPTTGVLDTATRNYLNANACSTPTPVNPRSSISVLSPVQGSTYVIGTPIPITWGGLWSGNDTFNIQWGTVLSSGGEKGGSIVTTLTQAQAGCSGYGKSVCGYSWTPTFTLGPTNQITIVRNGSSDQGVSGQFSVVATSTLGQPSITVSLGSNSNPIQAGQYANITYTISPAGKYDVQYILVPEGNTPIKSTPPGSVYDSSWGGYNVGGYSPSYSINGFSPQVYISSDIPAGTYHLMTYLMPSGSTLNNDTRSVSIGSAYTSSFTVINSSTPQPVTCPVGYTCTTLTNPTTPTLSYVSPTTASVGQWINIYGSNFSSPSSMVVFNGKGTSENVSPNSISSNGTQISLIVPQDLSLGAYSLTVENLGNNQTLSSNSSVYFTVVSPAPITPVTSCPGGYSCFPIGQTPTCPAGYACTYTTNNCPSGFTCYTNTPTTTPQPTQGQCPAGYTCTYQTGFPAPVPSATQSQGSLSAYVSSASTNMAGIYGVFSQGSSNGTGFTSNDWDWTATLTLPTAKTAQWIYLSDGNNWERWFTGSAFGLYPLVIYENGAQLNSAYDVPLSFAAGTHTLSMYGQPERSQFPGGTLTIQFTDGTYLTAQIPSTSITPAPVAVTPPPACPVNYTCVYSPGTPAQGICPTNYVCTPNTTTQPTITISDPSGNQGITVQQGSSFTIQGMPQNVSAGFTRAWFFDPIFNNSCSNNSATTNSLWTMTCTANTAGVGKIYVQIYQNGQTYTSNTVTVTVVSSATTTQTSATLSLDAASPLTSTIQANGSSYPSLPVLVFDVGAQGGPLILKNLIVSFQSSGPGTLNTAYLYQGSTKIASAGIVGPGQQASFSVSVQIPVGVQVPLTVQVDASGITSTTTISASINPIGVNLQDQNGNNMMPGGGGAQGSSIYIVPATTQSSNISASIWDAIGQYFKGQ